MKSFYAHFNSLLEAGNAVNTLKEHGFIHAHVDAAGFFRDEHGMELSYVHDRKNNSLSSLVLKKGSFLYSPGKGPLTAAAPDVSGISCGERSDLCAVVIAKAEDGQEEAVKALLEDCGGRT